MGEPVARHLIVVLLLLQTALVQFPQPSFSQAPPFIAAPATDGAPASPVRFAVIGDVGTGERTQFDVARQMAAVHERSPFAFVLMLGDNMYGRQQPTDFVSKFERPYEPLLNAGVRFFGALGNHDNPNNRFYPGFNMGGARFYTFVRHPVRFIVLDTNIMDPRQLTWLERTLAGATEPWKIAYFHHPLYSSGRRHGSDVELRVLLEPIFVKHGVNVVFAGHEHIYERVKPQKGITHFVAGSGGKLRKGDLRTSAMTAAGFDDDCVFMVIEVEGATLSFRAISRTGSTVDSGVIVRPSTT